MAALPVHTKLGEPTHVAAERLLVEPVGQAVHASAVSTPAVAPLL